MEMLHIQLSCYVALVLVLSFAEISIVAEEKDGKDYRLPKIIKPIRYQIAITIDNDFPTTKKFKGYVKMSVNVQEETSTIVMHSANITYEKSTKYKLKFDEEVDKMTLTFDNPLKLGRHDLEFRYQGILFEDMNGLYLSYYEDVDTKKKEWLVTTQFQPTYARRAFPSFDEPEFKAEYQINVTRPLEYTTLSNTVLNRTINSSHSATDIFTKTPKMSSYLVAIVISKFKGYGQTNNLSVKQYDVYCTEPAMKTAAYAYDIGQKLIDRLSKYTAVDYYEAGIPKLYQVAIPDFSAGAMENWGLVTFRESDLLFDEDETPIADKSRVATVIAHEFAHMWFGDIVTTEWWSTTWLNEGFAEYFSYFIMDEIEPKWELLRLFVVKYLQTIFYTDALSGSVALTSNVSTSEEVADKFNTLSYSKGASIVRMMHFISRDTPFLQAIRDYIKNNMYKNTNPSDLWKAFSDNVQADRLPENTDFGTVMSTWTDQSGFPIVYAYANGNDVVLAQKRFLYNKTANGADYKWYVPITYTTALNTNFSDDTIYWLTPEKSYTIEGVLKNKTNWCIINLMQYGYYRVEYDSNLWDRINSVLKSNDFTEIEPLNRAQIIDDMFNLAKAGLIKYGPVLDMTLYLSEETDYYPWISASAGFEYLRIRSGSNKMLQEHILTMMKKLYNSVSFNITRDTPYLDILKTSLALATACELEYSDCLSKASALFEEYKQGKHINPNIREIVYCNAIRQSHTSENWNFLWKKYLNTRLASEKDIMLSSLACSKDKNILLDYLKKSITKDSGIRKQDAATVFTNVMSETNVGYQVAYKFFKENIKEISEYYAGMDALSDIIFSIADRITTKQQLEDFEKLIRKHPKELKEAVNQIDNALENARSNLHWPRHDVFRWLDANYSSAGTLRVTVLTLFSVLICTVYNLI